MGEGVGAGEGQQDEPEGEGALELVGDEVAAEGGEAEAELVVMSYEISVLLVRVGVIGLGS